MRTNLKRVALAAAMCLAITVSSFIGFSQAVVHAAATGPNLSVDVGADRHAISNDIYGMNNNNADVLGTYQADTHLPVNRWGGDATTNYNWLLDSSNSGNDWYFMGGGNANPTPGAQVDSMVTADASGGTKSDITVPLIGYVNGVAATNCSYPQSKYPNQQSYNPYVTLNGDKCGNGKDPSGNNITDTNIGLNYIQVDANWMKAWIQHLVQVHGTAAGGQGVQIYQMDNEPESWGNVHRDVHPASTGFDEYTNSEISYASMIKSVDPTAALLGPSNFGVPAYFDMGLAGDNEASHNMAWTPYFLSKLYQYQQQHGVRLLDYLDQHYYGNESNTSDDAASNAQRLRSTRSLWDPTYTDESWVGQTFTQAEQIQLIPRMRQWAQQYYPGTKTSISEYNFGDMNHLNGALAEADALGIFGRERLDLATLWGIPAVTDPGRYAFDMYRNFDGKGAEYGDTWVKSVSSDQGQLAVYGAQRSIDHAMTIMVVNKTGNDLSSNLSLANFTANPNALVYTYSGANLSGIVNSTLNVASSGFSYTYPANSITEMVIPQQGSTYVGGVNSNPPASQKNTLQADMSSYTLTAGQTYPTIITDVDANGVGTPLAASAVSFSSDNAAIASVNSSGVVTGNASGTAHITVSANGKTTTITVNVIGITSITVSPTSDTLAVGGQDLLGITSVYSDNSTQPVSASSSTLTSDNTSVVAVNGAGILTATGSGTAHVTVSYNGFTATTTVTVLPTQPLPAGWQQQDIGAVATSGDAVYNNGVYSVTGAGSDVYGKQDQGHFLYQSLPADGTLIARITNVQNVQGYAAGGLMIRDGLNAGANLAFLAVFPNGTLQFKAGNATAGNIGSVWSNNGNNSFPYWLKLDRTGDVITASISPDGQTWTQGAQTPFPTGAAVIGLFSTAHGATIMNTSTFDNVTFNNGTSTVPPLAGTLPAGWAKADIGAVTQPANVGYQNGTFTLQATGTDVSGTTDQEGFIYQALPGDGSITARVASLGHSDDYAKAGVMIRNGLQPGSDTALLVLTPIGAAQVSAGNTTATNGITNVWSTNPPPYGTAINAPYWLRLGRSGGTITAFTSPDGSTWTQQYQGSFPTGVAYIGLEGDAHNNLLFNTATFDNVTVSGSTPVSNQGAVVRLNSGGSAAGSYGADGDYSGGSTSATANTVDTSGVSDPAPQGVYQSERYGNFTYTIPKLTPNANYLVRLHFAEIYWSQTGQRVFNVTINGGQVLSNFDIVAAAGAANKAIVEEFTTAADSSGTITITFTTVKDNAKVSGIELLALQQAINAGGSAASSFGADSNYSGGSTAGTGNTITMKNGTAPAPQAVYQSERYGNFTYTIPNLTPKANYLVRLHFAEIYWSQGGQRVFNVAINGNQVLSNFDIVVAAGAPNTAIVEAFTATADSSGTVTITFTTVKDNAKVSGLEVYAA